MHRSQEIRQQFIDYFKDRHGHTFVPSSPVVPHDDPTLLFANAGMNQFKDVFLGTGQRPFTRVVNTQKCIRAGGKHNDLEDVGTDTYHHTFFEMLGNWSFGDYFKEEAIAWAWELLTDVWGLDSDRLHATYFQGDSAQRLEPDEESRELWLRILPADRVHPGLKKDNFWEMADTGPCGVNSEIHVDLTPDRSGSSLVNCDDPRMVELWNLVFIQYNRDASGSLTPLPARHVDTGLGFERICAVLQGKGSDNYATDLFTPIFKAIHDVTGARPYSSQRDDPIDTAYRVIADHIRCLTFAITDGAVPGNEGRGYVLRRILRRAVRMGRQTLGVTEPFLCRLVPAVVELMGQVFHELQTKPQDVMDLIKDEEESFGRTIGRGIALFEGAVGKGTTQISGADAFMLHDTYGFPLDLTQIMATERGFTVDLDGFNRLMADARTIARAGGVRTDEKMLLLELMQKEKFSPHQKFIGYDTQGIETDETTLHLFVERDGRFERATEALQGDRVAIVNESTPFYAESGGQVGDTGKIVLGELRDPDKTDVFVTIEDTVRVGQTSFHLGAVIGGPFVVPLPPDVVRMTSVVEMGRRARIMANHTMTHLINRALRVHVNDQADQKGSLVDDEKLRFDFSHHTAVSTDQIKMVEQMVNADIQADLPVYDGYAPQADALKINNLRAVFGEKYPPTVRIVSIGVPVEDLLVTPQQAQWFNYSIELCGGTHLGRTSAAEKVTIISEEAVAKGVRRITALTGEAACRADSTGRMFQQRIEGLLEGEPDDLAEAVADLSNAIGSATISLLARAKLRSGLTRLQKSVKDRLKQLSKDAAGEVVEVARRIADKSVGDVIVTSITGADANMLRIAMDVIRKKCPDSAMLLGGTTSNTVNFVALVPKAFIGKGLKAGDWVKQVAKVAGGGGGGRPDMAQAGGKDPSKLDDALKTGRTFAELILNAHQ